MHQLPVYRGSLSSFELFGAMSRSSWPRPTPYALPPRSAGWPAITGRSTDPQGQRLPRDRL